MTQKQINKQEMFMFKETFTFYTEENSVKLHGPFE